jgi:hypothetical protein
LWGELGELFVNRESFDIYVYPRCGRVEFFVDGIGESFARDKRFCFKVAKTSKPPSNNSPPSGRI